jgi:hypothetical protein
MVNYLKQMLCNHKLLIQEKYVVQRDEDDGKIIKAVQKVYMRCEKCGYFKSHWKYV